MSQMLSMRVTGLDRLRSQTRQFPAHVTAALRTAARAGATRILHDMRRRLADQTHGTGATSRALHVVEDEQRKHVRVEVAPIPRRSANVALWLEFGSVKMSARPFMRPAVEAANAQIHAEMTQAVDRAVRETFEE